MLGLILSLCSNPECSRAHGATAIGVVAFAQVFASAVTPPAWDDLSE